jgi:hypothetical protein
MTALKSLLAVLAVSFALAACANLSLSSGDKPAEAGQVFAGGR